MSKETEEFVKKVVNGNKKEAKKELIKLLKEKIIKKMREIKETEY